MKQDLDIDERDALDCLDEYFSATEKEPDEFDCYALRAELEQARTELKKCKFILMRDQPLFDGLTAELEQARKWAKAWKKSAHFWRDRTCDRIGDQKAHVWYSVWRGFRQGRFD